MYTLYWERLSGAIGPQMMLLEIGAPFEKVHIDMAAGEHLKPSYLAINPAAQIPALKLPDGRLMAETTAITIVLGERHPEANLVPGSDAGERPFFLTWLSYMAANGYKTFSRAWHPEQFTTDESANHLIRMRAEQDLLKFFGVLEGQIQGESSFVATGFSALDVYLVMLTLWDPDRETLIATHPKIAAVCSSVEDRPSFKAVKDDHGM